MPPVQDCNIEEYVIARKNTLALGLSPEALADNKRYTETVGGHAKNNLVSDLQVILSQSGFVVTGNKSVIKRTPMPVSKCHTSRADLLAFHPNHHKVVQVESDSINVGENQSFAMESNTVTNSKLFQGLSVR